MGYYDSSLSYMNAMIDSIDNGSMRAYMFGSAQSLVASSTPSQSFSESPISIFGGGIRPLLIYRGVESLAGYMADQSEGAGGPPHSISCANMRQAAISSNRALSQMTNTVRTFSPSTQETLFALSGPAYDAGYSFLANKTFRFIRYTYGFSDCSTCKFCCGLQQGDHSECVHQSLPHPVPVALWFGFR